MEIAIIGAGKVAERNYLPALLRHKDVSVTCYSRTAERSEEMGRKFGVRSARTLDEVFERQPDALLVLTREQQRLQASQPLLAFKPRRIFFEKPLVAAAGQAHVSEQDFWDGKALLEQAQAAGAETAMVFNYRFFDQIQRAKQIVQERNFGETISVMAMTHYACWSHCIDLILEFGGPLQEISAQQGTRPAPFESGEAFDLAASFRLGKNATGTLIGTSAMNWNFPLFELTFNFEGGRIHVRDLDQTMEVLDYRTTVHEVIAPSRNESRWDKYNQSFQKSVDAYLESIRAGAPPPVPGIAGLRELQFEVSLKKSVAEHRLILPNQEFPIDAIR